MATLFSAQSVYNAAQIVSFTPLPLAAVYLTGSEAAAGLPATITLVGRALVAYPIGWLMGRLGRRLGISIGLSLSVVGSLLCVVALLDDSFSLFLLGALINGFGRGTGEQSRYAAADIVPPVRASRAIGNIVFAGTIGAIFGPLLLPLSERVGTERFGVALAGPYALTAILSFIAFALIFILLRPEPMTLRSHHLEGEESDPGVARSLREIFSDSTVQLAVAALAISQLVMTLIMVITPLHMDHGGHATADIAWVMTAHTLGMFGLASVTGRMVARYGTHLVILVGALILSLSAILAPVSNSVWMLSISLFLLGLGWNFGFVAGSALLAAAVAGSERGRTQGASETLVATAAAMGSFATGPAFLWGGFVAVSMMGLALALALITAVAISRRSRAPSTLAP